MNLQPRLWLLLSLVLLSAAQATTGVQRIPLLEHNTYGFVGGTDPRPSTVPALTLPYDRALERAYGKRLYTECSHGESIQDFKLETRVWKIADGHFTQTRALEQLYGFDSCPSRGGVLYGLGVYRNGKLVFAAALDQPHLFTPLAAFKVIPQRLNTSTDLIGVVASTFEGFELDVTSLQKFRVSSRYYRSFKWNLAPDAWGREGSPPHTVDLVLRIKGLSLQGEVTPYQMVTNLSFKRVGPPRVLPSQPGRLNLRVLPL